MIILIPTTTVSSSMGAQMRTDWTPTARRPASSSTTVASTDSPSPSHSSPLCPSSRPSRVPSRVRRTLSAHSGRRRCSSSSISVIYSVDTPRRPFPRRHPARLSSTSPSFVSPSYPSSPPATSPPRHGSSPSSSITTFSPSSSSSPSPSPTVCSPPSPSRTARAASRPRVANPRASLSPPPSSPVYFSVHSSLWASCFSSPALAEDRPPRARAVSRLCDENLSSRMIAD